MSINTGELGIQNVYTTNPESKKGWFSPAFRSKIFT